MLPPPNGRSVSVSLALVALLGAANAQGQAQPNQVLDQVDAFNSKAVLEMAFDRPSLPDATALPISGSELAACKLTASGLYCLEKRTGDGKQVVRQWQEPLSPAFVDRFQCDDSVLGLQNGTCTGLTVDLSGAIWVAGRKATSTAPYSLVKVVNKALLSGCPGDGGWTELSTDLPAPLCALEFATGAGLLSDLDAIDGEVADPSRWLLGPGILALKDGAAAIYFNLNVPGATPTDFAGWGVQPPERLLTTTLLQVPQPAAPNAAPVSNYILAATNSGRILSKAALTPVATLQVFDASPQPPITIDQNTWGPCTGGTLSTCSVGAATLTAADGKNIGEKAVNGARGLGVVGGSAGNEIDKGERLDVQLPPGYTVTALQILFLYNGPEFGDNTEQASITTTDQATNATITYTLTASGENTADWTGPGTVSNCGATTSSGTGCFLITNPFPPGVPVNLSFTVSQSANATSDFSIGKIEAGVYGVYGIRSSFKTWRAYLSDRDAKTVTALLPNSPAFTQLLVDGDNILSTAPEKPDGLTVAPGISIDLDPAGPCGQPIDVDGNGGCVLVANAEGTAAKFGNVKLKEGPSGSRLFQVTGVPDCRYVPIVCFNVLGLGASIPSADGAVDALINSGVIVPLDPSGPNRRNPAAQLLNVTPLLPEDVTSQFDSSGVAPGGLPPLYVSKQYRGQQARDFRIEALFFKTETGVVFLDTYQGEIDVSKLSGFELGCNVPTTSNVPTSVLRTWDAITTVSETYKGVGGRYIDTITNVGCRNPTKISGGRTSLFPIVEVAPDTYGPTIRSFSPRVTSNNDAVFARLAQSLWDDVGILRRDFACKQADTLPAGGAAPLPGSVCNTLAGIWSVAKFKLDLCVNAAFYPQNATGTALCNLARKYVIDYQSALPASATGPDVANRLGEQKARVETFLHVFDTRFRPSIKPTGYCREWTALSSPPYRNCPAL